MDRFDLIANNRGMIRRLFLTAFAIVTALDAAAQDLRFLYRVPSGAVTISRDVRYGASGETPLMMDVYRAADAADSRRPALVFFNTSSGAQRNNAFYAGWAQVPRGRASSL